MMLGGFFGNCFLKLLFLLLTHFDLLGNHIYHLPGFQSLDKVVCCFLIILKQTLKPLQFTRVALLLRKLNNSFCNDIDSFGS